MQPRWGWVGAVGLVVEKQTFPTAVYTAKQKQAIEGMCFSFGEIQTFATTRSFYSHEALLSDWKGSQEFSHSETGSKSHEVGPWFNLRSRGELAPQSWGAGGQNAVIFCFCSMEFYSLNMTDITCWIVTVCGVLESEKQAGLQGALHLQEKAS